MRAKIQIKIEARFGSHVCNFLIINPKKRYN